MTQNDPTKLPETGLFLTLEGGEGSGKSTLIHYLKESFEQKGHTVTVFREPGGTDFSEDIRNVFMSYNDLSVETSVHVINAQRQDNLEKIVRPALSKGHVVIADRYIGSTFIYQGYLNNKLEDVAKLVPNIPRRTIFVDVRPEIGLKRISDNKRETNRFDIMTLNKHQKIYEGYHKIAQLYPDQFWTHIINGEQSLTELKTICQNLTNRLIDDMKKG